MNAINDMYQNSQEHLFEELLLVDLFIHAQVLKFRMENRMPQHEFQGLFISETEIDALINNDSTPVQFAWPQNPEKGGDEYQRITNAIKTLSLQIEKKTVNTLCNGISLNLIKLKEIFKLNAFEMNVLCICLAPQFDSKYCKLFAYLQNDVTRKNPSVELILNLTCPTFKEKVEIRSCFTNQAALFKNNILQYIEDPREPDKPLITRDLKVNHRIIGFVLDNRLLDEEISHLAAISTAGHTLKDLVLPAACIEKLQGFIRYYKTPAEKENFIFAFTGSCSSQKLEIAEAICNEIGITLITIDLAALYNSGLFFEKGIKLITRESHLLPAAVYYANCDFLFSDQADEIYLQRFFLTELNRNSKLAFIGSTDPLPVHGEFSRQRVINLHFTLPDYAARKALWHNHLDYSKKSGDIEINELANKYKLTGKQIQSVITTAETFALWRNPADVIIGRKDLHDAIHIHSNQELKNLAQGIKVQSAWDDIILPDNIKNKLKEIVDMVTYKHIVYTEWDFAGKFSLGKGVSAMFYGEPGTGKTMACNIIANELDMDLYKIDISTIVSKYIGDTEKNLNKIFNAAENSNAILFFDEADALFGKRTEVTDSHDRYANIEVSYLLQKIDEYTGIVILATNLSKNMDEAFERRLHFAINFPLPDKQQRFQIWKRIFPKATPLDPDLDFDFLAEKFDISGGHIKNIALAAAFFAAKTNAKIAMKHILRACEREFDKIGRIWNGKEFSVFYS